MSKIWLAALAAACVCAAAPALAQESAGGPKAAPEMAAFWRDVTLHDLDAAHALVRDNHPGAVPEVGDTAFQRALEDNYALAKTRAAQVTDFAGYQAVLAAYAWGFGDKHVWSRPMLNVAWPDWAGLIVSKQGDDWVISDEDALGGESLLGAKVISCDGRPVNDMAKESLGGYRAVWAVGAQQIQQAPWLLIDEHNPFLTRPKACDFDLNGAHKSVTLNWRRVRRDTLAPRIKKAAHAGAAGYGVRKAGDGYWIALQDLQTGAPPVIAQVKANAEALRRAPYIVLDMRGNGGGSSDFGAQIADIIYGHAYLAAKAPDDIDSDPDGTSDCGGGWRTSPGNLRQLDYYQNVLLPKVSPDAVASITRVNTKAKAAAAQGKTFAFPLACPKKEANSPSKAVASTFHGRMILLTDNLCFSSCLLVTDMFRKLGALHVGQATDSDTHYFEVREEALPSGLSRFSTLMVVNADIPLHMGPFEPSLPYSGDIADTPTLEAWVIKAATAPAS